jgi:hypothetical protein
MPALNEYQGNDSVKLLVVGDSGAGKTGSLASLVDAGYNLRIIDLENKLRPLVQHVKKKENINNVQFETIVDEYKMLGTTLSINKAPTFQKVMGLLNGWGDLGPVQSWGSNDILVIDTLSRLGRASLNMVLQANGFGAKSAEIQHWGTAMENIEKFLATITNTKLVPCHLIMLTHLTAQESDQGGIVKMYPEALGTKLNPKVARYFDNMVSLSLSAGERSFKLKKDGMFACKTSKSVSQEKLPIETGLADLFKLLRD